MISATVLFIWACISKPHAMEIAHQLQLGVDQANARLATFVRRGQCVILPGVVDGKAISDLDGPYLDNDGDEYYIVELWDQAYTIAYSKVGTKS